MATAKLFKVIGKSTLNGKTKVRFANDLATRIKNLVKNRHTDVELFELPEPMTKAAGLEYARANNLFAIPADANTEISAAEIVDFFEEIVAAAQ